MTRTGLFVAACMAAGLLVGCTEPIGRARSLGEVGYQPAFATAREVLAQYYSIESADPQTGVIRSRPKPVQARAERIVGKSDARQVATMRLRRDGREVIAHLAVAIQRQGSTIHRQMRMDADNYSSVPNQTPAEVEGATTPEQNESWRTDKYDRVMEQTILNQLYRAMHPQPGK